MRFLLALLCLPSAAALVPLLDGGKQMPALYNGWMNEQIAKQASKGISNAIAAGYDKIEVQFPPVPNVDEVRKIRDDIFFLLTVFRVDLYPS